MKNGCLKGSQGLMLNEVEKNKSFDQVYLEDEENQSLESLPPQIDMNRRKSCEALIFGRRTSFQRKIELAFPRFQTRYQQKKLELERKLMEMEAQNKMAKSMVMSSIFS